MIQIHGTALGKVRGDTSPVIVIGMDMQRAIVLHQDGTFSTPRLQDVVLNTVETTLRFDSLNRCNQELMEEAREGMGND